MSELEPITNKIARYGDGAIVYHNQEAVVPVSVVLEYIEHYKKLLAKSGITV